MSIPYRQIHLDFHTSEHIPGIGSAWNKEHWQKTLQTGHVNGINVFAVCHHGWSYYDTKVGKRHPHLADGINLTRIMIDACNEIDVKTQVYLTVGVNNMVARQHSEWRAINVHGGYYGWSQSPVDPGFHMLCFNTPYLDYVCDEIRELARLFPDTEGFWLDIIHKAVCYCPWCMESMVKLGLNPADKADVETHADIVLQNYYKRTLAALREVHPTMMLTQNSGHVVRGDRRFLDHVTHLELESLPTWGWGYDHFPMSAKYSRLTGMEFLGMTGKFHTTWGEFGGFKHPNALRYECAAMIAYGAKCSVGDQLHPDGLLDESTYKIIGEAYAEVEAKEAWCDNSKNIADVGLLSAVALDPAHVAGEDSDTGAARILFEGHILFDMLDSEMDFKPYKLLIVSDEGKISPALKAKLDNYIAGGGKILFTGRSIIDVDGKLHFDCGADIVGDSEFTLDYILPLPELRPSFIESPMIIYSKYPRIKIGTGTSLGDVYEPYFERAWNHFCSHQHAPARREVSGYSCGVEKNNVMWLPMDLFVSYRKMGQVALKDFCLACIRRMLGNGIGLEINLPSTARVSLTEQPNENRYVLHLLYGNLVQRGGLQQTHKEPMYMEVIEDLTQCCDVKVSLLTNNSVSKVTLEPQGIEIPFNIIDGRLTFVVDSFICHQMVCIQTKN
ncbi:MAG: alpha-amylase family protein [bacterium]